MDLKTKLIYQAAKLRLSKIARYGDEVEELQVKQLRHVLDRSTVTSFAKCHGLSRATNYREYAERVAVQDYEGVKADIERMIQGERDVLIPGACTWYAKSSGTTSDRSKFIPVPYLHLQDCHYRGGSDALWIYLRNNPDSRFFSTKGLVLGGSHSPIKLNGQAKAGDLSAILVEHMPILGNILRVPSKQTLLMSEWTEKMQTIVREVAHARVGSLSGVPSWMLVLLKEVLRYTGAEYITDVWPELEVFFHGGISFSPYRETYQSLIPSERMHYEETYNASEGFFAIQDDPNESGMLLMLDYGIFYEFIPMEELTEDLSLAHALPLWEVELGKDYALVITTLGGLYRYLIGDTVRFTSLAPYRITISGRTKHFINAFGEELIMDNAEKGLAYACKETGAEIMEYTAAPVFMDDNAQCRHQWLIEFSKAPKDLALFASLLDRKLQELNSDYEAKRFKDITLQHLEIIPARRELFNDWLKSKGKLGGQHKVPRLSNSRKNIEELLNMQK